MTASLSGVFNIQEFTAAGALAASGRVYTYAYGTTTHKDAYTNQAGTVAHTYTSDGAGGQFIALDARGEMPAPLYLTTGSYDICLKTSAGATVWTRRADPVGDLTAFLSGTSSTTIASDTTTDLSTSTTKYIVVSGSTTITGFGTATLGTVYIVRFSGAPLITHNGTSLILPGAVNIQAAAGDMAQFISEGSGNWRCVTYTTMTRVETIYIPASAMITRTTSGAASGSAEMSTNKNMVISLDFDATSAEYAQFSVGMAKGWNEGTVTFIPYWSHAATVTNFGVVWKLRAVSISDDDALDVAFGTAQSSTDTGGTTNDLYIGPESSAITIAGTPQENDYVMFEVYREPSDGSDTLAVDARLHGLKVKYTRNTWTDA